MTGGSFTSLGTNEANAGKLTGHAYIYGPKRLHLPILTIGFLGIQLFWSVEQSYGSPYLLSLGLSKSTMAMVFVAGPLSGLIVQPLIGVLADGCTSRWGRRRPYMMGGVLICISAMLLLGWTRQVGAWFTSKVSSPCLRRTPCSLPRTAIFSSVARRPFDILYRFQHQCRYYYICPV